MVSVPARRPRARPSAATRRASAPSAVPRRPARHGAHRETRRSRPRTCTSGIAVDQRRDRASAPSLPPSRSRSARSSGIARADPVDPELRQPSAARGGSTGTTPPATARASPHRRRVGSISAQTRHIVRRYVVCHGDSDDSVGEGDERRGGLRASARRGAAVHDACRAARHGRDGERLVRFSYATDGTSRRGPVTLRERDLAKLGAVLERAPELRRALELGPRRMTRSGGIALSERPRAEMAAPGAFSRSHDWTATDATRSRAAAIRPSSSGTPPVGPSSGSTACSGCGIRPRTLPLLVRDARDALARAVHVLGVAEHDLAALDELGEERRRRRPSCPRRA